MPLDAAVTASAPVPAVRMRREGSMPDLDRVAAAIGVPALTAYLVWSRGTDDEALMRRMLAPSLKQLRPPTEMAGFEAALDLLQQAKTEGWRVGIFGDYDVDGVTTATILSGYLEAIGIEVVVRVAHRERGYGFGVADAQALHQSGAKLVLCGDTGTSDIEALGWLREHGVRSVVIDHHQVPEVAPPTDALINPHQEGCGFPFKGLCSAGVAFYLCAGLRTRLSKTTNERMPDPRALLDLVALATVCDMMPLADENRVLVASGLRHLQQRGRPGVAALSIEPASTSSSRSTRRTWASSSGRGSTRRGDWVRPSPPCICSARVRHPKRAHSPTVSTCSTSSASVRPSASSPKRVRC